MKFYQECLGGELKLQEVGATPVQQFEESEKNKILHSSLTKKRFADINGLDMIDEDGYTKGNNIALAVKL